MCLVLLSFQTKQRPRNKLCFAEKINQENIRCGLPGGVSVRAGAGILTKFNKQRQLITGPHTHVADTSLQALEAGRDRNTAPQYFIYQHQHQNYGCQMTTPDKELNPPWTHI